MGLAQGAQSSADAWPGLDWLANKKPKKDKKVEELCIPKPVHNPILSKKSIAKVIIEEAKAEEQFEAENAEEEEQAGEAV